MNALYKTLSVLFGPRAPEHNPYAGSLRGTRNHVRNAMYEHGIPLDVISRLEITSGGYMGFTGKYVTTYPDAENLDDDRFTFIPGIYNKIENEEDRKYRGRLRYFKGIENPLFCFDDKSLMQQKFEIDKDGRKRPKFRLNLTVSNEMGLTIYGSDATIDLYRFITEAIGSSPDAIRKYRLGSWPNIRLGEENNFWHSTNDRFINLEFNSNEGYAAKDFINYINKNYCF